MPLDIRKPVTVPYLRTLLMGQPKVGKTTFIGTSGMRTLVVDFEGGDAVLPINEYIDVFEAKSIFDMDKVYAFLTEEKHDYELLVIDSLTSLNRMAFLEILDVESKKHARRDSNKAEIQDYSVLQTLMLRLIYELINLPMHVMLTAHPKSQIHPELGTRYVPLLQPNKVPDLALAMFNEVVYLAQDEEANRFLLLNDYPIYAVNCRVRSGITPPATISAPTMAKFFDALRGEYSTDGAAPKFATKEEMLKLNELESEEQPITESGDK